MKQNVKLSKDWGVSMQSRFSPLQRCVRNFSNRNQEIFIANKLNGKQNTLINRINQRERLIN